MKNWNGTKPKYKIEDNNIFHNGYLYQARIIGSDRKNRIVANVFGVTRAECLANSELICDAGNTIQKYGEFPSTLLEQRDLLLEMLKKINKTYVCKSYQEIDVLSEAIELINKIQK